MVISTSQMQKKSISYFRIGLRAEVLLTNLLCNLEGLVRMRCFIVQHMQRWADQSQLVDVSKEVQLRTDRARRQSRLQC